ncbi:DUF4375 domain-containing protein [Granulicella sp. dw_53]|uniref:DMP19 family protein n=1 Tax=Granulicella sp. dw_53 TaxID=2719792 RepID=UPI001BD2DD58|nr:DUF4375 domain-containing protein [Granulicella sp. dw_53]
MSEPSNDPESYIDLVWEQIDIYNGAEAFLNSYAGAAQPAGLLYAAHFAQSEICNGGFMQLFLNSTGVLSLEAAEGFRLIGMQHTADLLVSAMQTLGDPFPRDRKERQSRLEAVSEAALNELAKRFYVELETENAGFDSAISIFCQKQNA